jgi:hypothetical protein
VQGCQSWNAPAGDIRSGFAIGVNAAGLACADTNVATAPGALSEDLLVQLVLERCASVVEATQLLKEEAARHRYAWSNLVLADRFGVAAVEVRHVARVILHPRQINRTDHHASWGESEQERDRLTSRPRFETARELLGRARQTEDVLALCRSHRPEPGLYSICRHGPYTTVYSYVFAVGPAGATLYVCQGNPCRGKYVELPLTFGADTAARAATMARYPSGESQPAADAAAVEESVS